MYKEMEKFHDKARVTDELKQGEYSILIVLRLCEKGNRQAHHHGLFYEHVYVLRSDKREEEGGGMEYEKEDIPEQIP